MNINNTCSTKSEIQPEETCKVLPLKMSFKRMNKYLLLWEGI